MNSGGFARSPIPSRIQEMALDLQKEIELHNELSEELNDIEEKVYHSSFAEFKYMLVTRMAIIFPELFFKNGPITTYVHPIEFCDNDKGIFKDANGNFFFWNVLQSDAIGPYIDEFQARQERALYSKLLDGEL